MKSNSNYLKFDSSNDNLKYFTVHEIKDGTIEYIIVSFDK